jgi:predicted enzyme related to lactoylglutathione lyase
MEVKYKHTNIIARDWRKLARFYEKVFGCAPVPPERNLSGSWLEKGTGVSGAQIAGIHLLLPGCGENGPTLEIYQYSQNDPKKPAAANREGWGHIAFEVSDVSDALAKVKKYGGRAVGGVTTQNMEELGLLTFVYATDPEGNIIELQSWK